MDNVQSSFSGFSVDDIEKAKQFYTVTLGLKLGSEDMGLRLELPGGGHVFVYQKQDHQPAGFTILNFIVPSIDDAVVQLTGKGITFERYDNMPAKQDEKGILRGLAVHQGPDIAWFKDPAGNIMSVIQDK